MKLPATSSKRLYGAFSAGFRATAGGCWARRLGQILTVTGVGVWTATLLAPQPRAVPPLLQAASDEVPDTTPVARWFGGETLRVRASVTGLIASDKGQGGAAVLSVNGQPARAFRIGDTLAPGVTLTGISPTGVTVDQDGAPETIRMRTKPSAGAAGLVVLPK